MILIIQPVTKLSQQMPLTTASHKQNKHTLNKIFFYKYHSYLRDKMFDDLKVHYTSLLCFFIPVFQDVPVTDFERLYSKIYAPFFEKMGVPVFKTHL